MSPVFRHSEQFDPADPDFGRSKAHPPRSFFEKCRKGVVVLPIFRNFDLRKNISILKPIFLIL